MTAPEFGAGTRPGALVRSPAGAVRAAAVVLHGGRAASLEASRSRHLAALRMRPFAAGLARAGRARGLTVWTVRYRLRGWNDDTASPVEDARAVLAELRRRHGGVPTVLLGHSMGGRAALRLAADPGVVGVVGLAPWIPPCEPVADLSGCRLRLLHGERDRVTDPGATVRYANSAATMGADTRVLLLRGAGHAMLWRAATWQRVAVACALECLEPVGAGARPEWPRAELLVEL